MIFQVITTSTPLWADRQRTRKKGKIEWAEVFESHESVTDGGLVMLKSDAVTYLAKPDDTVTRGDGWIEAKNCKDITAPDVPIDGPPSDGIVFLRQLRDALIQVLGA